MQKSFSSAEASAGLVSGSLEGGDQVFFLKDSVLSYNVSVAVYNASRERVGQYGNYVLSPDGENLIDTIWSSEQFSKALSSGEAEFRHGRNQAVMLSYEYEGAPYIILATGYDIFGFENERHMTLILVLVFIVALALLFASGVLLARGALKPIAEVVDQVELITSSDMDKRLPVQNEKDELGELALSFNGLLDRLESAFDAQKMFVSNVSHELRTPLAALLGELDLALLHDRTPQRYKEAIENALHDGKRMKKLIDGLLNLAKADYQKEMINMEDERLDEMLLDAREQLLRSHPDYTINLLFTGVEDDDERMITVRGNEYLLEIALSNLMDNNCKYSDNKTSFVQISSFKEYAVLRFSDNGAGIAEDEKDKLFSLFYRGEDGKGKVEGHGIGMTLTQKIIALHEGSIEVLSMVGEGTTFVVKIPHI